VPALASKRKKELGFREASHLSLSLSFFPSFDSLKIEGLGRGRAAKQWRQREGDVRVLMAVEAAEMMARVTT